MAELRRTQRALWLCQAHCPTSGRFAGVTEPASGLFLFGDAAVSEFAEQGEAVVFALAGFDEHEDPGAEDADLEDGGDGFHGLGPLGEGGKDPVDEEPGDEQVEALEGVEAGFTGVAEAFGGEDDDGGDPADQGDVAEDGGAAGVEAVKGVA